MAKTWKANIAQALSQTYDPYKVSAGAQPSIKRLMAQALLKRKKFQPRSGQYPVSQGLADLADTGLGLYAHHLANKEAEAKEIDAFDRQANPDKYLPPDMDRAMNQADQESYNRTPSYMTYRDPDALKEGEISEMDFDQYRMPELGRDVAQSFMMDVEGQPQARPERSVQDATLGALKGAPDNATARQLYREELGRRRASQSASALAEQKFAFTQQTAKDKFGYDKQLEEIKGTDPAKLTNEAKNYLRIKAENPNSELTFEQFIERKRRGFVPATLQEDEQLAKWAKAGNDEAIERHFRNKRASQIVTLGDRTEVLDPTDPGGPPLKTMMQGIPLKDRVDYKAAVKEAEKEAEWTVEKKKNMPLDRLKLKQFKRERAKVYYFATKIRKEAASFWATGAAGALAGLSPSETPRSRLAAYLKTLHATLAFGALQSMRESSKTGGALGQVSERELELLQASQAALDSKNKTVLLENLKKVEELFDAVKKEKEELFRDVYRYKSDKDGILRPVKPKEAPDNAAPSEEYDPRKAWTKPMPQADSYYDPATGTIIKSRRQ
jgi:hypothetical protein